LFKQKDKLTVITVNLSFCLNSDNYIA